MNRCPAVLSTEQKKRDIVNVPQQGEGKINDSTSRHWNTIRQEKIKLELPVPMWEDL